LQRRQSPADRWSRRYVFRLRRQALQSLTWLVLPWARRFLLVRRFLRVRRFLLVRRFLRVPRFLLVLR
jgi:hypothetical protein